MDTSPWFLIFYCLTIWVFFTFTVTQNVPLFHLCSSGNFTSNSTYAANLNRLLSSFSSNNIANDYGFYNLSSGQDSGVAYGIALCRGDINSGNCLGCINKAATELTSTCPNQIEAAIWYDYCMLRYTNRSIIGVPERDIPLYSWNLNDVTNVDAFNQALTALLDSLKTKASSGDSLRKFATGSVKVTDFQTIYALVQCTPDLTAMQCSSCVSLAVNYIPQCCSRKQDLRLYGLNCNLRFGIDRFYNLNTADTPLGHTSPPPTSTIGKRSNSSRTTIIITVSVCALTLLLVSSCVLFLLRVRKSKGKLENANIIRVMQIQLMAHIWTGEDDTKSLEALLEDFSTCIKILDSKLFTVISKLAMCY
ncbi:hypothetical protein COLO4_05159 [Corchorus olitorius]|uniref:Gnk2-homologous domain-containing protein n=1 Tax=Corchorus olitorius TaxID=93759 RepID=A0A1R3KRP4_9ROSI|nr:hypothetical protein COLO4_05159 [Corchorus olitorius]